MSELFRARGQGGRQEGRRLFDTSVQSLVQDLRTTSVSQRPRHAGLFEAVRRLDAEMDATSRRQLADWVSEQYAQEYGDIPLGFIARCYLGAPYVDHRLSLLQSIVEHYQPQDVVPSPFDRGRTLARLGAYEYIVLYASGLIVPVRVAGSVDVTVGAQA